MKTICLVLTLSLFHLKLFGGTYSEIGTAPWGVDCELEKSQMKRPQKPTGKLNLGQKSCRTAIRFFQVVISPIDGPRSSFYPTSSQFTLEAIQKYGVFRGIALGCDRLMRENGEPWIYETTDKYGIKRKLDDYIR